MSNCTSLVKSTKLSIPAGMSRSDLEKAICLAVDYSARPDDDLSGVVNKVTTSLWPQVSKAVEGNLQHVVSVDNGSTYAELWHTPEGNWYTVASESPTVSKSGDSVVKFVKADNWTGIFEIPKVHKGMRGDFAAEYFVRSIFGPNKLSKGGCGCKG